MGLYLLAGGFVGGLLGVQGIKVLRAMGNADFVIKITYVLMLGIVGAYMFIESLQSMRKKHLRPQRFRKKARLEHFSSRFRFRLSLKVWRDSFNPRSHNPRLSRWDTRCNYGRGRRLSHGPDNVLHSADAYACDRRHEPLPDSLHLHRGHFFAVVI